jgi:hypothetical protein
MSISTDEMQFNEIDEQYSKEFFYKYRYDCADVYIWSGQICFSKDYIKKIINACNDEDIKNILSQALDDRETYCNVRPLINMEKTMKRESYERFWGPNNIKGYKL